MAHALAGSLQQMGRIRECCTLKEANVYVRSKYIDVAEGRVAETCDRTAVMQGLADFVTASSHHLKPLTRDSSQFTSMLFQPRLDGEIVFDRAIEAQQQFRFHRRSNLRLFLQLLWFRQSVRDRWRPTRTLACGARRGRERVRLECGR